MSLVTIRAAILGRLEKATKFMKIRKRKLKKYLVNSGFLIVIFISSLVILSSLQIGGFRLFVVKTGSMAPKIKTGSVVFTKKLENYQVGDAVTFRKSAEDKDSTTHRIVSIEGEGVDTNYWVKGDANNSVDPSPVMKYKVIGKAYFSIPFVGYFISLLKTPLGLIIFIIIPATVIIYEEIGNIRKELEKIKKKKNVIKKDKLKNKNSICNKLVRKIIKAKKKIRSNIIKAKRKEVSSD